MSRIRSNQITNQSADGAPVVQNGLVVTGVTTSTNVSVAQSITATSFFGSGAGLIGVASTDNIVTGTAATFTGGVDINSDLDVDGHTNLDNVSIAGVTTFSGGLTGTTANFSGNVTVGGVLTYEDVKNVDSIGIITARSGVDVDDFLDVGSNIKLGNAGVITATTFKGDGDFVELDVDGHTNLDNVSIAGVATATLFSGASQIGIQSAGTQIGAGITQLNFVGTGNTFAVNGTTVDISIAGGGGGTGAGGTWSTYTAGIATNKSIGVNTSSLDDNDLQGIGASTVDTTIMVTVGVDNVGGQSTGVFYLDGVEKPALFELNKRHTYIFDQSDNSNEVYGGANHPLMFSLGPGGDHNGNGHYMAGVTYKLDGVTKTMMQYTSGFNAATTRQVIWTIPANAPALLYYWCHHHTGQGNSFAVSNGMAKGMYISNGMIIHDNTLNDNHYIGTAFNGLMAGPVTINGNLFIDGNYVVV